MLQGLLGKEVMGRGPSTWDYLILTFSLQRTKLLGQESVFLEEGRKGEQKAKNWEKETMMNLSPFFMIQGCTIGQVWASPGFLICSIKSTHFCQWKVKHKTDFWPENCTVFALHLLCTFTEYTHTQQREETQDITHFDLLTAPYSSPSNTLPDMAELLS